jgi:hypothetical protein
MTYNQKLQTLAFANRMVDFTVGGDAGWLLVHISNYWPRQLRY